jgi:SAM-dependent methyltransferase
MKKSFRTILTQSALSSNLIHGILSSARKQAKETDSLKIVFRPINTKEGGLYQISEYFSEKVLHRNVTADTLVDYIDIKLKNEFKQGILFTVTADYHLFVSKDFDIRIVEKKPTRHMTELSHNRQKQHILPEGHPVPYLIELGVMDHSGKVLSKKSDKFKQINKFLEFIRDIRPYLNEKKIVRVVDFGCGKAYLTFALYHYLHDMCGVKLEVLGMDLKSDVVKFCQDLANRLEYQGLQFAVGDINGLEEDRKADLVISLHACDTATDAALEKGIRWKAGVILAVPCCQHELYKQVRSNALGPMLDHGILKERFAALATDAARAQLLEILGYHCQIMEFIDMEHTPKNLLIKAVRASGKTDKSFTKKISAYMEYKKALHIAPSLEKRFQLELEGICKEHGIEYG